MKLAKRFACVLAPMGCLALTASAGDLTPPTGAVAPTMVTLDDLAAQTEAAAGKKLFVGNLPYGTTQLGMSMSYGPLGGPIQGDGNACGIPGSSRVIAIDGEPTRSMHPVAGGGAAGRQHKPLTITKELDKASPQLMLKCCTGEHIPEVKIQMCRGEDGPAPVQYLQIKMTDCLISSYQCGTGTSSGGDSLPYEEITINFSQFEIVYIPTGEMVSYTPDACLPP